MLVVGLLLQGFYYDGFYGELGLNDNHFPKIEAGAAKAAKVLSLLLSDILFDYLELSYIICHPTFIFSIVLISFILHLRKHNHLKGLK